MSKWTMGLALVVLVGCVEDLGEGRVEAEVKDVPATEAPGPTAAGVALKVDEARSKVHALGAKITAKHPIVFHDFDGEVKLDGDTVSGLSFTVQVASLESDAPRLTEHLKKEDFLWVDQHPTATFRSVSVEPGATTAGMTHTVTGDLTIRGVTKRVAFPAKIDVGAGEVTADTEFTIDRRDFAVTYPGKPDDLVQDTVVLTVGFVAPRSNT